MRCLKAVCCAAAVVLLLAPLTRADEWNKKTILTFSGPVQIPGATLGAGTYVFKLADIDSNRHVVQVMDKDEKHIYGMLLAIPNQRLEPTDDPVVLFAERSAGTPQAVRAWFYPGETIGNEFVYPKDQALKIARAAHTSVLAMEDRTTASTTDEERMTAMRGAEVSRVDETGTVGTTGTTEQSRPATTTASSSSAAAPVTGTTAGATAGTTAAEPSVGSTASEDATLKNSSGRSARSRSNAVGTSGQAERNARKLPRTASNLTLFELLSGLAVAAGLGVRRVRLAASR